MDHHSIRAFNSVMWPRGANDAPGQPSAELWRRLRGILDSLRRIHPAPVDSIVNGPDDDGSGSMIGAARQPVVHRSPDRSARLDRDQINVDMIARGGPQEQALKRTGRSGRDREP